MFEPGRLQLFHWPSSTPPRARACYSSAADHMPDGEVAERHRRGERQARLVADAMLGGGCDIASGIEARNGMTPLMDYLSSTICEQADRRAASRT